ncbi:MAG: hypothetical protein LBG59_02940 [Candidatus Peribacteria bacterium]|nr:hypothetical protein [Candidatus Peribacteria bacterium]
MEFDVNVWKNYLSDLIQLQINKDEEIQSVIGWTQKEIDVVAPVVAKQKSDSENRQEETSNSTPVVNNFIDKYKNSKDWF